MNREEAIKIYEGLKKNKNIIHSIDKEFFLTFAETLLKIIDEQQYDIDQYKKHEEHLEERIEQMSVNKKKVCS